MCEVVVQVYPSHMERNMDENLDIVIYLVCAEYLLSALKVLKVGE